MIATSLSDGELYSHWTDVLDLKWPWQNFTPIELASKREGEFYLHPRSFDALQRARTMLGMPVYVNSGHRSWLHNIAVGGAPLSNHRFFAADISLVGFEGMLGLLYRVLRKVGFKGFGFYSTFIHVDMGRGRFWFGSDGSQAMWMPVLSQPVAEIAL